MLRPFSEDCNICGTKVAKNEYLLKFSNSSTCFCLKNAEVFVKKERSKILKRELIRWETCFFFLCLSVPANVFCTSCKKREKKGERKKRNPKKKK